MHPDRIRFPYWSKTVSGTVILVLTLALAGYFASQTTQKTVLDRYTEQPVGIKLVERQAGTKKADIEWLQNFRGRIVDKVGDEPRISLSRALKAEWRLKAKLLESLFPSLSDRQRLIAFTTLRVGGSFSTYAIRTTVPNELEKLLMSHRGNCSDQAFRLAMALDSLGLDTALIPVLTPSTPGHFIVDAYDDVDGSGYLLDSLFNVVLIYNGAKKSFITKWIDLSAKERLAFFDKPGANVALFLPTYFRFVDGGVAGLKSTPVTIQSINSQSPAQRRVQWLNTLTSEWPQMIAWWRNSYPNQPPRTLDEMANAFEIDGILEFEPQNGVDTQPMWQAAGLYIYDPSSFQRENAPALED